MLAGKDETQGRRRFARPEGWTGASQETLRSTPPPDRQQGFPGTMGENTATEARLAMRGQGRIFRRRNSPFWWIGYYARGREHRESARTVDPKKAERFLRHRLREVGADKLGARPFISPTQERVRTNELIDDFEAQAKLRGLAALGKVRSHLRPVREYFKGWRAVHVTATAVDAYAERRVAGGMAPATINREIQLLSQALRLGVERERISASPRIRRLPENNVRTGFFEDPDFRAMLSHLPAHLQGFCHFAYLTGWRRGEIASLTWEDIDRAGRVVRLRPEAAKNRCGRQVALEGELWEVLERAWQNRKISHKNQPTRLSRFVFHQQGRCFGDFRKAWCRAAIQAGLGSMVCSRCSRSQSAWVARCTDKTCKGAVRYQGPIFHDLRRTCVRNLIRAGVPEVVAMRISGHKTRAVFDRYNIVSDTDLREAVRRQQEHLDSLPAQRSVSTFASKVQ